VGSNCVASFLVLGIRIAFAELGSCFAIACFHFQIEFGFECSINILGNDFRSMSDTGVVDFNRFHCCWFDSNLMIIGCSMVTAFASGCIPPSIS